MAYQHLGTDPVARPMKSTVAAPCARCIALHFDLTGLTIPPPACAPRKQTPTPIRDALESAPEPVRGVFCFTTQYPLRDLTE
jgi:hypothetical protein